MAYTIGEIAKRFNISISTIRYYDKEGLLPNIKRENGIRKFSEQDVETIFIIECLKKTNVELKDINYINAHGTSTPAGDVGEALAVKRLFGDDMKYVSMSSTKSAIGHLLGAAGAVEAVFTVKALQDQICPPTLNLENPAEEVKDMDLVPLKAKKKAIKAAMSNSFGFGGTNSSLIFKVYEE